MNTSVWNFVQAFIGFVFFVDRTSAFGVVPALATTPRREILRRSFVLSMSTETQNDEVSFESLIDMDVVIYSHEEDETQTQYLGALQENGSLAPLSAWTTEPAFGESLEFLVDEEDRFSLDVSKVKLHCILDQSELSYGSRQCQRGVGNPHGEESELLYYVEQKVVDKFGIEVVIKPDLEILW